jgi:hypothetical protein
MRALTTPKCLIASARVHKVLTIILHTLQVTKQQTFLKLNPNDFFILVVTNLHQTWPSYFLSMPCIWKGLRAFEWMGINSNKTSPSKVVGKNYIFCKRILSSFKVCNSLEVCLSITIAHKQEITY